MVGKRRFSALKCILVCENQLRIEAAGVILSSLKSRKPTNNYDSYDVMTPLATSFAQTPVVYDYAFNYYIADRACFPKATYCFPQQETSFAQWQRNQETTIRQECWTRLQDSSRGVYVKR